MSMRSLLEVGATDPAVRKLAREGGHAYVASALRPYVIGVLAELAAAEPDGGRPLLAIVGDDRAARDLAAELEVWLGRGAARYYPSRGVAYESHLIPPPHLVGLRLAALDALMGEDDGTAVVAVAAGALLEKVPDPALRPASFRLRAGEQADPAQLAERLAAVGYERAEQVEERGEFAVRGGLVDVFPVTAEHAVRVDFFGDEIESLRWFSTFTQRSLGDTDAVEVAPAAELAAEYRELIELAGDAVREGEAAPGIAELLPVEQFVAPLDLLAGSVRLVVAAEEELSQALEDGWSDVCTASDDGDASQLYASSDAVRAALAAGCQAWLSTLAAGQEIELRAQAATRPARTIAEAEAELERLVRSGYRTVVAFARRGEGERAAYNLGRLRVEWLDGVPPVSALRFAQASLQDGFIAPQWKLAVIPAQRLVARRRVGRIGEGQPTGGPAAGALRAFTELRTGDYVVHEDHGIARFAGFQTRTVAAVTRDYLYLEYQGDDRVWVPTDQLAKITRYVSAAGVAAGSEPPLSKLGGRRWETMKARARRAAQELAGELLALYAERAHRPGHAFAEDSSWQREFEAKFPYAETADQLEAIEAVKADMEAARPMDRLICGDVGYGKTEVALRAAFKAVADGTQVMMLAPTTILAAQHFGSFSERLRDYPMTVDHVSRLRTPAEQRAALRGFAEGRVDVLIGTHRLLSQDVRAKSLGLLIVDEEQRFGVKQKEMVRALKVAVDVLAMSATPIPRTLQMSLAGLRDISVIETPPEGRRPVRTYVGEHDEELVRAALEREHGRGGQTFYLHNRVETIGETAERLRALCPQLRLAVAHGQMDERELERVMMGYLRGHTDVLVCTSIIESGLDVPQANTLIVEQADRFGLAQLYQIRGRVGRRRERAYAYLLYDSAAALSAEAAQRLAALSDHTELGSGFALAMRDLEIRGAGDLLGAEQSGHVAALGFELYMQMLEEAVAQAGAVDGASGGDGAAAAGAAAGAAGANGAGGRDDGAQAGEARVAEGGEARAGAAYEPVRLDVKVDAYVPAEYVPYERAKIEIHKRVAQAREVADLELLRAELQDRFGPLPEPVGNLLALARARIKFGLAGARAVSFRGDRLAVSPIELDSTRARKLREELPEALYESGRSQVSVRVPPEGPERFPTVVRAAEVLLAVTREAA